MKIANAPMRVFNVGGAPRQRRQERAGGRDSVASGKGRSAWDYLGGVPLSAAASPSSGVASARLMGSASVAAAGGRVAVSRRALLRREGLYSVYKVVSRARRSAAAAMHTAETRGRGACGSHQTERESVEKKIVLAEKDVVKAKKTVQDVRSSSPILNFTKSLTSK